MLQLEIIIYVSILFVIW